MRKTAFFALVFITILAGCDRREKNKTQFEPEITLGLDVSVKNYQEPDAIFDTVSFIALETNDDNPVGVEFQIVFTDDRLIVSDYSTGQILFFTPDGKFLNKISRRGRGPGEYLSMSNVMVDAVNDQLIVHDIRSRKMIYYDESGALIKEIANFSNGALIRDIIHLPDGGFLCYTFDFTPEKVGTEASGLWKVDADGVFVESYFNQSETYDWGYTNQYSAFQTIGDDMISLKDTYSGDIYHYLLREGKLEKYIAYKQPIIPDIAKKSGRSADLDVHFFQALYMQESGDYVISWWMNNNDHWFYTFYDKKKKDTKYFREPFDFSRTNLTAIAGWPVNSNRKDVLVMNIPSTNILESLKDPATPQHTKDVMQGLVAGKTEDEILQMNPIFQLLHFKQEQIRTLVNEL